MSSRVVVTGAAGMIGSNLLRALNCYGIDDIIAVDNLKDGRKFSNLVGCQISDYIDKLDFLERLDDLGNIDCIFHQGACSKTTEWDGRYMMENNYTYSKKLYQWSMKNNTRLIYASSAAVYGMGANGFRECPDCEAPLNVYGYSKLLFDNYIRFHHKSANFPQVAGLRYFNVYGPYEQHKDSMASVAWHLYQQQKNGTSIKLFGAWDGYEAGMQQRDFIYVADAVAVNIWLYNNKDISGIFNCGSGEARTFKQIAEIIHAQFPKSAIEYIPFPEHLKGSYQSFTQADMHALRAAGFDKPFYDLSEGVKQYISHLENTPV